MADDDSTKVSKVLKEVSLLETLVTATRVATAIDDARVDAGVSDALDQLEIAEDMAQEGRLVEEREVLDIAEADPVPRTARTRHLTSDQRKRVARKARAELMRRRFSSYLKGAWATVEGSSPLEWFDALQGLCDHLQNLAEGWFAANGVATRRQLARVIATWQRHGLEYVQGELLVQNTNINMPPGTLKSRVIMVFFPTWVWLHAPRFSCVCASSNDEVVKRDSDDCRKLIESPWYRQTFGVKWKVRQGTASVGKWQTTAGGWRMSRPIMAGFVGIHADGIFIDDPDDPVRVWSDTERQRVHYKYKKTIANRVMHLARSLRVITQQIVHGDCLSNNVRRANLWSPESRQGWSVFCVPMEAGQQPDEVKGPTAYGWVDARADGALLLESRFPRKILAATRLELGSVGYNAQYNQNADVVLGGMFATGLFRFVRFNDGPLRDDANVRPREDTWSKEAAHVIGWNPDTQRYDLDWLIISVDANFGSLDIDEIAAQDDDASAVGIGVIAGKGMRRYVLDDDTKVRGFFQTIEAVKRLVTRYEARRVLIEKKANGASIIAALDRAMRAGELKDRRGRSISVVIEGFEPGSDPKVARARAMAPDIEAGLWYVREGAGWLPEWFKEVCVFPKPSVRDDRVDYMSQVSLFYAKGGDALTRAQAMGRF